MGKISGAGEREEELALALSKDSSWPRQGAECLGSCAGGGAVGAGVGVLRPWPLRSQGRGARLSAERAREELWTFEETRWESVAWGVGCVCSRIAGPAGGPSEGRGVSRRGPSHPGCVLFSSHVQNGCPGAALRWGELCI